MKKKYINIVVFLLGINIVTYSQEYNSVTYYNYTKAEQIFNKHLQKSKYDRIDSLDFSVKGNWHYLDHYNIPKKREIAIIKENVNFTLKPSTILQLNGEVILFGDKYKKVEYRSKDSLSFKDYGEGYIKKINGINKMSEIIMLSPVILANDIQENIKTLKYIGFDNNCHVLAYLSSSNKQISVFIKDNDYNIFKIEILDYDNIQGDFITEYLYQNYALIYGINVPLKLVIKEWGTIKKELKYEYKSIVNSNGINCKNYTFKEIEDSFYSVTLPTKQHRVFVVDFGDYLGVIESPVSNKYSKCLYDNIKQHFPNKKIKYVFLTHHHPDHAGGFGYFFKKGATIISTEMSINFFKELLNRKHTIKNNNSFKVNNYGKFEEISINGYKEIKESKNSIQIYEFGSKSMHTDEFLLYYLPKQKSIIISDLWRVPTEGVYPSKRALNIYTFIKDKKLTVEKIYQTWPLYNFEEYGSIQSLKKSAKLSDKR